MHDIHVKEKGKDQFWIAFFVFGTFFAFVVGMYYGADMISLALCLLFSVVTIIGITGGFHRCFTHKAFAIKKAWLKYAFLIAGSMAAEASVITWVCWHHTHHKHTDEDGDPHSPMRYGSGFWNIARGFFHAHIGWLFITPAPDESEGKRLREDPIIARIDRQFKWWLIAGLVLPPVMGMIIRWSPHALLADFLWGGPIRLLLVHHITWCVNSVCHIWGDRPFKTGDRSTNNFWIALLALGEGYHNFHHAEQRSARQGVLKGQIDVTYEVIRCFEKLGWVEKVHLPSAERIREKMGDPSLPLHPSIPTNSTS
jgi:stearoyl-CoA desaturase (Delta-9 desaturase)